VSTAPEARRARMTAWFNPSQLLRTAVKVIVSSAFSRHADARLMEAALPDPETDALCDYSANDELWLDYVADTGDGWNSTYHVAYCVAQPSLQPGGCERELPRGQLLLFGGDEVYPTASREAYQEKLVAPYAAALPPEPFVDASGIDLPTRPHVFAIPGNHDWYDSLVAFRRLFCTERAFGGWRTKQARSYFALKLPHDWWLMAPDVQLESDIDAPQLEYFRTAAVQMERESGDRAKIILCLAEPHWIYAVRYRTLDPAVTDKLLDFLEHHVFGRHISIWIAGDIHHYRRHESVDASLQKVTCGGGGAFVDTTHADHEICRTLGDGSTWKASFPPVDASRRMGWRNLWFPLKNPRFGIVTCIVSFLVAWAVRGEATARMDAGAPLLSALGNSWLGSTPALAYTGLIIAGILFFTDTHSRRFQMVGGTAHALAHIAAAAVVAALALQASVAIPPEHPTRRLFAAAAVALVSGYVLGGIVMGVYLTIACQLLGRQSEEAFSALQVEDWKSWLRMRVAKDGVTIYPIGLERVSREWTEGTGGTSRYVPGDLTAVPILIEPPIRVPGSSEREEGFGPRIRMQLEREEAAAR
jgi:hypothetical protein